MSDQATYEKTQKELMERINDCRIRILEELGMEVPPILRAGARDGND